MSDPQNPTFDTLKVTTLTNLHTNTNVLGTLAVGDPNEQQPADLNVYGTTTLTGSLTVKGELTLQLGGAVSAFSGDPGLSPGDNQTVPTQLAVKSYVEGQVTALNQAIGQKAALGGSASQPFAAQQLTLQGNVSVTAFSGDTGLSPTDDQTVPTQLAVKTYVDGQVTALNQAIGQKAASGGSASQPFAAQQLTCSGLTSGVVGESASVGATLAGNGGVLDLQGYNCAFITWYLEGVTPLTTNDAAYMGFPVAAGKGTQPDLYIRNQVSRWDSNGNDTGAANSSVIVLKGANTRVSMLNLQIDDQNASVNQFGHLDPNANGYEYGNLSFLGRPMIMFNESYNTYPWGTIIGALGFYGPAPTGSIGPTGGPFYGSHGQFHYRSWTGFECLDVSADRPNMEHSSTAYAYLTAKINDVSSKEFKKDIQTIDDEQHAALLVATLETPLATFRFLEDSDAVDPHLGVIAETCPGYIVGQDGKSVRVTAYTAMLHGALKVLARRLAAVEACLADGAGSSSQSA